MRKCPKECSIPEGGVCEYHPTFLKRKHHVSLCRGNQKRYREFWDEKYGGITRISRLEIKVVQRQREILYILKKSLVADSLCSSLGRCKTNNRPLLEVFNRLEQCVVCPKFQYDHCSLDHGCDKRTVYQIRLQRRDCEYWDQEKLEQMSRRIKVAIHSQALNNGGAERWIVDLTNCLDPERIQTVVTLNSDNCDPVLVAKINVGTPVVTNPRQIEKVHNESDIVLCWGTVPQGIKTKVVFCSHGCGGWAIKNLNQVRTANGKVFLTAVSRKAACVFSENDSATVIWNGCDEDRLQYNIDDDIREELKIKPTQKLIGYVGRVTEGKGLNTIVAAGNMLKMEGIDNRVMIVGMPQNIRGKKQFLASLATLRPAPILVDRTEYVGPYYKAMDVYVLPSLSEGFSLAMVEAWLSKIPVVATPVGAVEEVEKEFGQMVFRTTMKDRGRNTLLAIKEALSERGRVVAEHAYRVAKEHFTLRGLGERWSDYLEKVANDNL